MDLSSILGILLAAGFISLALTLEGGSIIQLFHLSAFLIVFGGTFSAILLGFSGKDIRDALYFLKDVFFNKKVDLEKQISEITNLAQKARKEGIISLETETNKIDNELLKLGLQVVINGADPIIAKDIMESRLSQYEERVHNAAKVYESAGGYAPTMGILGAVMGLIQVIQNLTNPTKLGMGIAVAFVATIYGVGLANFILLPIANKIKVKNKSLILLNELIIEGVLSIQAGESPVLIERKLKILISEH